MTEYAPDNGASTLEVEPTASVPKVLLPPIKASGFVLSKDELLAVLRLYLPTASDVSSIEDGRYYCIFLAEQRRHNPPA